MIRRFSGVPGRWFRMQLPRPECAPPLPPREHPEYGGCAKEPSLSNLKPANLGISRRSHFHLKPANHRGILISGISKRPISILKPANSRGD
jgi:hypothetical protein